MTEILHVRPARPGFVLDTKPPGSKSLTNRALLLAAMAPKVTELTGCLDAEDTRIMEECLGRLGVSIRRTGHRIRIHGKGQPLGAGLGSPIELEVGTAGTVARFLTAALAGGPAEVIVDGSPRMRERPMAELVTGLRAQGARLSCPVREGFLPIRLHPSTGLRGGEVSLGSLSSSQFPSALIFAALGAQAPTRLVLEQGTPARPYVDMTVATVQAFGGQARWDSPHSVVIEPGLFGTEAYHVEPDASSASYLLTAAAIFGGRTTIRDLGRTSLQGDARFVEILAAMGAQTEQTDAWTRVTGSGGLTGVDVDLSEMPDMTLTLAVAAMHAKGPTTIRGVAILRHHESDRLAAAATELAKFGCRVDPLPDGLRIWPPPGGPRPGAMVKTYRDHRMAMAFALAGHVAIEDPACVGKTYPGYFTTLAELGMVEAG